MRPDSIEQARELVEALSRFCRSIEEIATLQSDADGNRQHSPELPGPAHSTTPKVQLLALTELVQHSLQVLGELLTEVERSRVTHDG